MNRRFRKMSDIIRGIDVSKLDAPLNKTKIPNDIAFVSMKATEGITFEDPNFQDNYHYMQKNYAEIVRIPYHLYRWKDDPIKQVDNVISQRINFSGPGTAPLMLDLESDGDDEYVVNNLMTCLKNVSYFINDIRLRTGKAPIIYSFDSWLKDTLGGQTWPQCLLWISSFQNTPPPFIQGWKYSFWQYSQFGQLNGQTTGGHYDLDQFMGTKEELNKLANL